MEDWSKLKVPELKAVLKERDLPQTGLKAELIKRLEEDDQSRAEPTEGKTTGEQGASESVDTANPDIHNDESGPVESDVPMASEPAVIVQNGAEPITTTADEANGAPGVAAAAPIEQDDIAMQQTDLGSEDNARNSEHSDSLKGLGATAADRNESLSDSQKRKRRSLSPPPTEDEAARKRLRAEEDLSAERAQSLDEDMQEAELGRRLPTPNRERSVAADNEMDQERDVEPAFHPATSALYINNLMRPIRPQELREHLVKLAVPSANPPADEVITTFFLDQVRTHALVVFSSVSAASRVRTELHDRVWPQESNRKALSVDFVPAEKVPEWIDTQENAGKSGRLGSRWEVKYETLDDGTVDAYLESGAISSGRSAAPPPAARGPPQPAPFDETNSIPLGPRGFRNDMIPPTGPRSSRNPPPPHHEGADVQMTRARPSVPFQPVPESLAQRRLDNMRSFYTQDTHRQLGREINRYFFEDGDSFVDRGKEVFEGIRPPHRERGGGGGGFRGRGGGGRRGGGGGGGRGRSDRYFPGGRGDDRPPRRFEDEGLRLSRYADDR